MDKKTLKLVQFFNLEAELNGVTNPQTGEKLTKGILSEKLQLKTKYWLSDLSKKVKEQTDACQGLRDELIKKYGEEKDGGISIAKTIEEDGKKAVNPKFVSFQNEFNALLNEEREIEYKEISIDELGEVETTEVYDTLFSLLKFD
jgi:hypothetical protein